MVETSTQGVIESRTRVIPPGVEGSELVGNFNQATAVLDAGVRAGQGGDPASDNPYPRCVIRQLLWLSGWELGRDTLSALAPDPDAEPVAV